MRPGLNHHYLSSSPRYEDEVKGQEQQSATRVAWDLAHGARRAWQMGLFVAPASYGMDQQGEAGFPAELALRTCAMEDQHRFISQYHR